MPQNTVFFVEKNSFLRENTPIVLFEACTNYVSGLALCATYPVANNGTN